MIRKLFFLLLFFHSFQTFAVGTWVNKSNHVDQAEATSACEAYSQTFTPVRAFKIIGNSNVNGVPTMWYCSTNSSPCDLPQIWDQVSYTCKIKCEEKSVGNITTSTHAFLTCRDGCELIQNSNSTCVGTYADGYCTASYSQNGAFCPSTTSQPTPCPDCTTGQQTGTGGTGGTDTGGTGGTGGTDTGGTGGTGGTDTGGTGGTGGTDTGGTGGTGGTDTGGTGGTGGTNTGGTGGTGSTDSDALTKTELEGVIGDLFGSTTSGDDCAHPPTFDRTNSTIRQQIYQAWRIRCPQTDLNDLGDGKYDGTGHSLAIGARLQDAKDRYGDKVSELQNNLRDSLNASVSGGGSNDCPTFEIYGVTITGGICRLTSFFDRLGGLFPAISSILSAYILLRRS